MAKARVELGVPAGEVMVQPGVLHVAAAPPDCIAFLVPHGAGYIRVEVDAHELDPVLDEVHAKLIEAEADAPLARLATVETQLAADAARKTEVVPAPPPQEEDKRVVHDKGKPPAPALVDGELAEAPVTHHGKGGGKHGKGKQGATPTHELTDDDSDLGHPGE